MPFDRWGDSTDFSAPWTEWYDLPKLSTCSNLHFDVVLDLEITTAISSGSIFYRGLRSPEGRVKSTR
jgi:hypothetical protein